MHFLNVSAYQHNSFFMTIQLSICYCLIYSFKNLTLFKMHVVFFLISDTPRPLAMQKFWTEWKYWEIILLFTKFYQKFNYKFRYYCTNTHHAISLVSGSLYYLKWNRVKTYVLILKLLVSNGLFIILIEFIWKFSNIHVN